MLHSFHKPVHIRHLQNKYDRITYAFIFAEEISIAIGTDERYEHYKPLKTYPREVSVVA